jgi:hypothetical protein
VAAQTKNGSKKVVPGDPAHRKRVLRKMSTQPMKILNFLGLPCKKVSKSKMDFFKMWIPQQDQPRIRTHPGLNMILLFYIVSASNP